MPPDLAATPHLYDYRYTQWSALSVYRAMQLHASQWRWFRAAHALASRYSYANELEPLRG